MGVHARSKCGKRKMKKIESDSDDEISFTLNIPRFDSQQIVLTKKKRKKRAKKKSSD